MTAQMIINDESEVIRVITYEFEHLTINVNYLQYVFDLGMKRQKGFGKIIGSNVYGWFKETRDPAYSNYYFTRQWPACHLYEELTLLFLFQPSGHIELINALNTLFFPRIFDAWPTVMESYEAPPTDYYKTGLNGTSRDAQATVVENLENHLTFLKTSSFNLQLKSSIEERYYQYLSSNFWKRFKCSLFPLGYKLGEKGYGRLTSIPGSTLSNAKRTFKAGVLDKVAQTTNLDFFEVDLKGCHMSIFREMFDFSQVNEQIALPPREDMWGSMLSQFGELHQNVKDAAFRDNELEMVNMSQHVDTLLNEGGNSIKGILKNQTSET